jgi:hypothetical protein
MGMRLDLLSLTLDDLIVLSNRGLVNRSLKELESGKVTVTIAEAADGSVTFSWSDGVTCQFPEGAVLSETGCSCSATQICRHLLRSVLYYQRTVGSPSDLAETEGEQTSVSPEPSDCDGIATLAGDDATATAKGTAEVPIVSDLGAGQPWDPGDIADTVLEAHYKAAEWKRLHQQYGQGQIIELSRSAKPTAYFHQWGVTTRFMVPGDVRYVYCSCGEARSEGDSTNLCKHIPLAVWGFRSLREQFPQQATGVISTEVFEPIAPAVLDALEAIVAELLNLGITQLSTPVLGHLKRVLKRCESEGLIWLSEIWSELLHHHSDYQKQDAQFQPIQVTELLMEAECRLRALQVPHCPVPQLWIRGSAFDRPTSLGSTTLVGLGCGVRVGQKGVQLQVYVQDLKSGQVLIMGRDQESSETTPFAQLALRSGFKRFSLARLGSHQTIIKGGKRLPNQAFRPARSTAANLNPQTFAWENLRPLILVDNVQLLQEHLAQCPPPALRPRRLADNFWVIPIAGVRSVEFSRVDQCIVAALQDPQGNEFSLRHPYYDRGAEGAEILLHLLQHYPDRFRFVSGTVSPSAQALVIQPVALIVEDPQGQRSMVQPWIDTRQTRTMPTNWEENDRRLSQTLSESSLSEPLPDRVGSVATAEETLEEYVTQVKNLVTDLLMLGLDSNDAQLLQQIQTCCQQGRALGFHHLLTILEVLHSEFRRKTADPHWQADPSRAALRELLVWLSLATG